MKLRQQEAKAWQVCVDIARRHGSKKTEEQILADARQLLWSGIGRETVQLGENNSSRVDAAVGAHSLDHSGVTQTANPDAAEVSEESALPAIQCGGSSLVDEGITHTGESPPLILHEKQEVTD